MGKIQKGFNIAIDIMVALIIIIMIYQLYWGETDNNDIGLGSVIAASAVMAAVGWLVKILTGLFTRPMDAIRQKINTIPIKDGE